MATTSVDLLSVIPGLQIADSDILQAELLLSQTLLAQDPTLDIRTGTAIRDLAVRPSATLLATINKALVYYWTQNSLQNVDDNTPTVFVDKILSNFFMTRFAGSQTIINARLYFAKAVSVTLASDVFFSTDNVKKYFPISSATYTANQLVFDPSLNQYYLSINLQAEKAGTEYNISSGSLIYFSNFNPFFLHAEVNYLSSSSVNPETNTEFIARAQDAISTRNLVNRPSIKSNLLSNFSDVTDVYSVGIGDPEMVRDKVQVVPPSVGNPIWIHSGGCVDIYSRTSLSSSIVQFTTDVDGRITLTGPIYKTAISAIPGGPNTDTIPTTTIYSSTNSYLITGTPSSITRSGSVVTVVSTNHGLSANERVTVSGADNSSYNGTHLVSSVVDNDTFTYTIAGTPPTPATGTLVLSFVDRANDVGFSTDQSLVVDFSGEAKPILSVVWAPNLVTVTCIGHGYSNGDQITLSGLSGYNGIWGITVTSVDTFTFPTSTNLNPVVVGSGTARRLYGNQSVSLEIFYFQGLDSIQTYLTDPANRVLSTSQLARGFNITLLDVNIIGYTGVAPNQVTSSNVTTTYLKSLAPGQAFVMGDLLSVLSAAGISSIQTPISITFTKYWRDLLGNTFGIITDALNPNDSTNVFMLNTLTTSVASL